MLLPSALSCDSSQPRLQSALFISPPSSPQMSTQSAIGNLINSCRNLHSLITAPAPPSSQLPSPPLAAVPSPLLLMRPRLRRREQNHPAATAATAATTSSRPRAEQPRYRIKKRAPLPPPRGINKRRRAVDDDGGRDDDDDDDDDEEEREKTLVFGNGAERDPGVFIFRGADDSSASSSASSSFRSAAAAPSTPKRQRIAPPDVPRGLTREDFHKIGLAEQEQQQQQQQQCQDDATSTRAEEAGEWGVEDDHKLVEIVLEKVKNMDLSSEVWEDCVRNLPGRDYNSVSSRWRSLLQRDRIGLQNSRARRSRPRLHGTW